jgi:hypothetical protein
MSADIFDCWAALWAASTTFVLGIGYLALLTVRMNVAMRLVCRQQVRAGI